MKRTLLSLTVVIALTSAALAHQGATGVVKERMMAMGEIAENMKLVNAMLRGKESYDGVKVVAAMEVISAHAIALPHKFPKGSEMAPSEASPAIWDKTPEFNAIFGDLARSATGILEFADDKAAVAKAFGSVAGTCKACHEDFRISRK